MSIRTMGLPPASRRKTFSHPRIRQSANTRLRNRQPPTRYSPARRWSPKSVLTHLPAVSLALTVLQMQVNTDRAVLAALTWLRSQQRPDGGFSNGFSPESDLSATADAILALTSAGIDPRTWTADGVSPAEFLAGRTRAGEIATPGQAAKVSLAVSALGLDPRSFAGIDLEAQILAGYDPTTGFIGSGPFDSALGIMALDRAGSPIPQAFIDGLLKARLDDGSYSFNGDRTTGAGDSNTTALVVQALAAAGRNTETSPSMSYLLRMQNPDGGWTYQKPSEFGEETDSNSTALVIQALLASGEDLSEWNDPVGTLLKLQLPSGAFAFNASTPGDNSLATLQAVPALAGDPLFAIQLDSLREPQGVSGPLAAFTLALLLGLVLIFTWAGWRESGR